MDKREAKESEKNYRMLGQTFAAARCKQRLLEHVTSTFPCNSRGTLCAISTSKLKKELGSIEASKSNDIDLYLVQ